MKKLLVSVNLLIFISIIKKYLNLAVIIFTMSLFPLNSFIFTAIFIASILIYNRKDNFLFDDHELDILRLINKEKTKFLA
jgi:glycerol-3-phosphate acyltransferase PlsY